MTRIKGEQKPKIGFPATYTLDISGAQVQRWDIICGNKVEKVLDTDQLAVDVTFNNNSAGKSYSIRSWFRMNKDQIEPLAESIHVTPVLGEPHIITSSWQNMERYNVTQISMEDIYLVVKTANIPSKANLTVTLYDKEKIGLDRYITELKIPVDAQGIARKRLTINNLLDFRKTLYRKSNFGEDSKYQLYAKIKYMPANKDAYDVNSLSEINIESPVLIINNTESIRTMQARIDQSNKSVTVNQPDDSNLPDSKKAITLCLRVYFDGTGGNIGNVKKMMDIIEGYCGKAPDMNDYTPEAYERACDEYTEYVKNGGAPRLLRFSISVKKVKPPFPRALPERFLPIWMIIRRKPMNATGICTKKT